MCRLAATRHANWMLRKTRLRNHSVNARTMPRAQARMTRLHLTRARSISEDNGGTELSFSDIASSYAAQILLDDLGSGFSSRRDAGLEPRLRPVLNFF